MIPALLKAQILNCNLNWTSFSRHNGWPFDSIQIKGLTFNHGALSELTADFHR